MLSYRVHPILSGVGIEEDIVSRGGQMATYVHM